MKYLIDYIIKKAQFWDDFICGDFFKYENQSIWLFILINLLKKCERTTQGKGLMKVMCYTVTL